MDSKHTILSEQSNIDALHSMIDAACESSVRDDVFQKLLHTKGFYYCDLKTSAFNFTIDGKPVKKIKLLAANPNSSDQPAWIYFSFEDGTGITKKIKPDKLSQIVDGLKKCNAKIDSLYVKNEKKEIQWQKESMSSIYRDHTDATPHKTYDELHADIIANIIKLINDNQLAYLNVIDGGCGSGKLLKALEQELHKKNIKCKVCLVGFDFNPENVSECTKEYAGSCHFMVGNLLHLDKVFTEMRRNKLLHDTHQCSTVLTLSGSLTKLVLHNGLEAAIVIQKTAVEGVTHLLGGGQTQPLANDFIFRHAGFKRLPTPATGRHFYHCRQLSDEEILQNKKIQMVKRKFLDLSLSPKPGKLLKSLIQTRELKDSITIDLSFCMMDHDLATTIKDINKELPNIKWICWHWDQRVIDTLQSQGISPANIETKKVTDEGYLFSNRRFFHSILPDDKTDLQAEGKKTIDPFYFEFWVNTEDLEAIKTAILGQGDMQERHKVASALMNLAIEKKSMEVFFQVFITHPAAFNYSFIPEQWYYHCIEELIKRDMKEFIPALLYAYASTSYELSKIFQLLEKHHINPAELTHPEKGSLLHVISRKGDTHLEAARYLVKKDKSIVDRKDSQGKSPLHILAREYYQRSDLLNF